VSEQTPYQSSPFLRRPMNSKSYKLQGAKGAEITSRIDPYSTKKVENVFPRPMVSSPLVRVIILESLIYIISRGGESSKTTLGVPHFVMAISFPEGNCFPLFQLTGAATH
jgi:hypothetical protein